MYSIQKIFTTWIYLFMIFIFTGFRYNESKVFERDEQLIEYFYEKWNGALPGSFIYSKKGKQIKFFEGKQSYESLSLIIENML